MKASEDITVGQGTRVPAKSQPKKTLTIAEIAQEAGVSVATVSRVINKVDHPIDPKTRKRVEEVIKRKNYTSNVFGKGLAGQPNIIGISVAVPLSTDPGFAQNIARIMDGIKSVTRESGFHALLEIDASEEEGGVFAGVPLAGVLHIAPRENDPTVDMLRRRNVPFILIGSTEFEDCNYVDADSAVAGRRAVQHLYRIGRRKMAFFGSPVHFEPSALMGKAFREELQRLGLPVRQEWFKQAPLSVEGGREAALGVFALKERPDCIFTFADFMAVGAMQAARELGFEVPGDVSIIGYDDFAIATAVTPQLTTFRLPDLEMAARSARILVELIRARKPAAEKHQELFEPKLIVRESCGGRQLGLTGDEPFEDSHGG